MTASEILSNNPGVTFLTSVTHQVYPVNDNNDVIEFECKELTVINTGDYELIVAGSVKLQPGESYTIGGDAGEYITGRMIYRFGSLIGPGTNKMFTVARKHYV